jgi:hypothetical protein
MKTPSRHACRMSNVVISARSRQDKRSKSLLDPSDEMELAIAWAFGLVTFSQGISVLYEEGKGSPTGFYLAMSRGLKMAIQNERLVEHKS